MSDVMCSSKKLKARTHIRTDLQRFVEWVLESPSTDPKKWSPWCTSFDELWTGIGAKDSFHRIYCPYHKSHGSLLQTPVLCLSTIIYIVKFAKMAWSVARNSFRTTMCWHGTQRCSMGLSSNGPLKWNPYSEFVVKSFQEALAAFLK